MAEKNLPVGESIELGYQAPNKESGLWGGGAPIAEIYTPGKVKDSNFPDVALVEVGSTGTYRGEFIPDQQGEWQVIMHKADGDGQVSRKYSVGAYNVHSVGQEMAKNNTVAKEATLIQTELDIRGGDNDTLKDLSDQLDSVDDKVGELDTPPQAF